MAAAIQLGRKGFRVVLYEKERYPFHKVCGEYISFESWDFLKELGLPLDEWELPVIDTLSLSSPGGAVLTQRLPMGGFGISRYRIDHALAELAKQCEVQVLDGTKVMNVEYDNHFRIDTEKGSVRARACCGAFGKRSNLDVKWERSFIKQQVKTLRNFIGVKYHAILEHPAQLIALHNFQQGYCGISPVDARTCCICYLTTAGNLRRSGNDIRQLEQRVLFRNPLLHDTWNRARFLHEKPLVISRISFARKEQVEKHVLMLGDAAGMIAPLCGNGMSMALHSSKLAARLIVRFLQGGISRPALEEMYILQWKRAFGSRLYAGRLIQSFFGKEWLSNAFIKTLKPFPGLASRIVQQTHGQHPF